MPAYVDKSLQELLETTDRELLADLSSAYASDGFLSQYTSQTHAWETSLQLLRDSLNYTKDLNPEANHWRVLLELPLYRLRRRVDLLVAMPQALVVVELKVGAEKYHSVDKRQVEEYALDIRDFYEFGRGIPIIPVLWSTEANTDLQYMPQIIPGVAEPVVEIGEDQFGPFLVTLAQQAYTLQQVISEDWGLGAYKPVPSVIEAATTLFAGHGVEEITHSDAANLNEAAEKIVSLINQSRVEKRRSLIFLTGVPGSGKTLAGLQVVHRASETNDRHEGDIVYLSGNTPLVTVLREALTEDEYLRRKREGEEVRKGDVRKSVRARIQHIMDFLKEYISDSSESPPYERAIVFDEAQRAWDASYGKQKFGRSASEPKLLLDIMSRHKDWSVIIGLIGGGQEINSGENGMAEWGDALRALTPTARSEWSIYGPSGMSDGDRATAFLGLGDLPDMRINEEDNLTLTVPLRSFRSPLVADWVEAVLDARQDDAAAIMARIGDFPIQLTRDSSKAKTWLQGQGRGERRYGMVASSCARRLRAEGFGVSLHASDGRDIANWYLAPRDDVRSSFFLEVVANEYTTQGLELDFIGLCWGGDLTIQHNVWTTRSFAGNSWNSARGDKRRFILNSYRVLLTRAREGLVIWVPRGDQEDSTRDPKVFDDTAKFLLKCGAKPLSEGV
ncbi:DUF2075 domain-containing protein [Gemmatimonadota bacterium]